MVRAAASALRPGERRDSYAAALRLGPLLSPGRYNRKLFRSLCRLRSFGGLRFVDERHGRSLLDVAAQQGGVPIREPDATMGFGFADLRRIKRAMDAITLRR